MKRFDLRSLRFHDASEVWRTLPVEVAPFLYGGLEYHVPGDVVDARLTAARVGDNLTLTLEVPTAVLVGERCPDDDTEVEARGIEYVRHGESGATGEDEDEKVYVVRTRSIPGAGARPDRRGVAGQAALPRGVQGPLRRLGADLNADQDDRHEEASAGACGTVPCR